MFFLKYTDGKMSVPAVDDRKRLLMQRSRNSIPIGLFSMFWHRLGSDAGEGITGTEEEWRLAQELSHEQGKEMSVSIYFNKRVSSLRNKRVSGRRSETLQRKHFS